MNKELGNVIELFVSKKGESKRIHCETLTIDKKGVIGDKFYDKDPKRAILLTSIQSYDLALNHQISMDYGTLGENILIDYSPYNMSLGQQLKMGEVIIEIVQNCTICNHLSVIDKNLPKLLKDDRGVFVQVVQAGVIRKDDKVFLLD